MFRKQIYGLLRSTERYTKTDMIYLTKGSFWLNLNFFTGSFFGFILSILFGYLVSAEVYGTYQYILSLAGVLSAVTLTGFAPAITRSVAKGFDGTFPDSLKIQLRWGLISTGLAFIMAGYYFYAGNVTIATAIAVTGILLPISLSFNTYNAYFQGKKDFRKLCLYNSILTVVYFVSMVTVIVLHGNIITLIIAYFLSQTVANIILHLYATKGIPQNAQTVDASAYSYGKHLSLMNILTLFATKADNIIIFHLLGPAPLALYSFAKIIPDKMSGFFKTVSVMALPKFAERSTYELKKSIVGKTLRLVGAIVIGALLYIVIAPFFFKLFFPNYIESVSYSQLFAFTMIIGAAGLPTNALISQEKKKRLYFFTTVMPIVQTILLVVFILFFGLWGAVISKVLSNSIHVAVALYTFLKPDRTIAS